MIIVPALLICGGFLFLPMLLTRGWGRREVQAQTARSDTAAPASSPGLTDLGARALDLTYSFDEQTIYWPTDKSFHWEKTRWGPSPGGYWYASATYGASEHGGTHLDSPIHFGAGQATTDAIPLARLIGPAVVIDVTAAAARNRDYTLTAADLDAWEAAHGAIPAGAIVLVRTGWGKFWPDKKQYLGSDVPGDTTHLHFPGIGRDAAQWLVASRKVVGVGIDTASLDHGPSADFIAHRVLNGAGLYGLENVANLERVPVTGATVIALPMKIKGGSGGPVRLIAILPQALSR
jgi:kynurenine formamidase